MPIEVRQTVVFRQWIQALRDDRARARINARLRRLVLNNPGDIRGVGDAVSEMRVDYGPGYRIYFTWKGDQAVILLCGGDKGTQVRDIAKAKRLAREL